MYYINWNFRHPIRLALAFVHNTVSTLKSPSLITKKKKTYTTMYVLLVLASRVCECVCESVYVSAWVNVCVITQLHTRTRTHVGIRCYYHYQPG